MQTIVSTAVIQFMEKGGGCAREKAGVVYLQL